MAVVVSGRLARIFGGGEDRNPTTGQVRQGAHWLYIHDPAAEKYESVMLPLNADMSVYEGMVGRDISVPVHAKASKRGSVYYQLVTSGQRDGHSRADRTTGAVSEFP